MSRGHYHVPVVFNNAFARGIGLNAVFVRIPGRCGSQGYPDDSCFQQAAHNLHDRYKIEHITLQVTKAAVGAECTANKQLNLPAIVWLTPSKNASATS